MRSAVLIFFLALGACDRDDPQSTSHYNTVTTDSLTPKTATLREYWQNGASSEDEIRYYERVVI